MPSFFRSVLRGPLRGGRTTAACRNGLAAALAVALIGAAALLSAPAAALAAEQGEAPPTLAPAVPDAAPDEQLEVPDSPSTGAPPAAPTVTVDAPPVPLTLPTTLSGTRSADSEVQVQIDDGSGQPLCIAPASSDTTWTCAISTLPDGPVRLRIVALLDGTTAVERVDVAWLGAPTITSSTRATTAGQVGGSAYPGATVTARVTGLDSSCTITADPTASWTCILAEPLPTGSYSATATQSADFYPGGSQVSAATTVLIDKDAPAAPTVTAPGRGATLPLSGGTVSGRGEDGNTVIVFAGVHPVCQATVSGGTWSCVSSPIPAGTYELTALQLDPAGNASEKARVAGVVFDASTPSPTPSAAGSPSSAAPVAPGTPGAAPPTNGAPGGQAAPVAPGGPSSPPSPFVRDLRAPTAIGSALRPLGAVLASDVAAAFALSSGTMLLVVLPGLLGARTLSGRFRRPPSITGRNRPRYEPRRESSAPGRLAQGVGALGVAAMLVVLSNPVLAQSNYLRLSAAVVLALLLVNLVGTTATVWIGRRLFRLDATVQVRPGLLAVSGVAALLSRIFTLAPPIAFGQVLAPRFGESASARSRSTLALGQTAVLIVLAIGGWLLYGAVDSPATALEHFVTEFTSTVTFAASGAAAISLLPTANLPGRTLLEQSRLIWAATALVTWTLLFTVVTSVTGDGHATTWLIGAAAAALFAAFSLGTWAWVRFVEPALGSAER
ncbi:hypothetical protein [Herbiconiux sp. L3-i23]|uniref:hypothetical protein n=1 Tax=Herbiconiux sp. L3-i23 TaxID=2905871 RepID=UPI00205BCCB0|nr:hypothetical protein [Herbiconiux sp. L3-i23]BDI23588.1 hypothetical protein L3i23_23640 [Herbiconiux sp. L3-i23]